MRPPYRSASERANRFGQRSERPTPVTHGILLRWRGLPKRAAQLIAEKQWVVAEAPVAAGLLEDASAAGALEHPRHRIRISEIHQHTAIPCPPLRLRGAAQP